MCFICIMTSIGIKILSMFYYHESCTRMQQLLIVLNMLSPYHHTMALYISYFMSKNSTLVLVLIVSYSTINKVFIFILSE